MNENPTPSPAPRRLGRTAIAVHLLALAAGGAMFLLSHFQDDLSTREVFSAFGMAIGGVGLLWSVVLAIRAGLQKESLLVPLLIPLLAGWEYSVPLLLLWHDPQRGFKTGWYELHYLCVPLLIPLLTICATLVVLCFLIVRKFLGSVLNSARGRKLGTFAAVTLGVILWMCLLPFAFVLYGGTMAREKYSNETSLFWTVEVAKGLPAFVRNTAFVFAEALPQSISGELPDTLAERGFLSGELYIERLAHVPANQYSSHWSLSKGFKIYSDNDGVVAARKRLDEPFRDTLLDSILAGTFAKHASIDEIRELFKKLKMRNGVEATLGDHVLPNIYIRDDLKLLAGDIADMDAIDTETLRWKVIMLANVGSNKQLGEAYADVLQSQMPIAMIIDQTGRLRDLRRWPTILAALEHPSKEIRKKARVVSVSSFWRRPNQTEARFWLQGNPETLHDLLSSADRDEAVAIAILIHAMSAEDTPILVSQYSTLANARTPELDWQKIQSASAQEKTDLIEKARAILQKANNP